MAKNTNKFKSLFSGINRTGEQLINSVLNNANSSINSSDVDLINPSSDEKERRSSLASSTNDNELSSSPSTNEAEGFLCPQCFAAFPNAEILTEHFSSEHSSTFGDQNLSFVNCNHCRMRFTNEYELNQHVDKYHNKKKSNKSDEPLIAQLDQSTTKQLTDSFSQVLKSAFNNNNNSANNRQTDTDKMFSTEEFDLLQRQQKALEETKDLLLNELSLLRDSLSKKDEQINRMDRDFQQEKQLLVTQLNEAFQREKTLLENLNAYKDRTVNKDDEMNRLRKENENFRFEMQRYVDQLEKISNEKMQQEKLCQKLQKECDSNQKIILDMTTKTSDSLSVMTNEKTELMNRLQQLQLEMDSIKKMNEDSERQIKCLQMKNSDSTEYEKQLETIEQLRKKELDEHRNTIKKLKSDKLKYQNICRTRMEKVRLLLSVEQNSTKQMRTILEQTHRFINKSNQEIKQFVQNESKRHNDLLLKLEIELSTFMEEKRALLERCATAEEQLDGTINEMKQFVKKCEENSKAVQELGEQNQTLQIRLDEANNKLRRSWTDDRTVDKCQNDKCQKQFTTVIRKHHCRSCGNIFCNECSSKQAQMTGHPKPVRVCDHCYQELNQS
uniref:Early endosome antigen 1-like n=1 Tax=Dermatophagoides pteronyssinus TaxID=6956 RepID=A0A6P6XP34_DERPT|nr:early endosome antigen 1-like [Dermatophagoides pteronyssinus]